MEYKYLNLYIIGNGFDRYHGLETMYENFYFYIKEHNDDLLYELSQYYNTEEPKKTKISYFDDCLWSDFERALEYFKGDWLMEWGDDIPYAGSDDPRDQDRETVKGLVYRKIRPIKEMLQKTFNDWIKTININGKRKMKFGDNAFFLSFNYTETLEKIYKISNNKIIHIHGKAGNTKDLIFGHGWDLKKELEKDEDENVEFEVRDDLSFEIYPRYIEFQDDINRFLSSLHKDTEQILLDYHCFFKDLFEVRHICILGHSLSSVDMAYFKEIAQNIDLKTVTWYISYFNEEDLNKINYFIDTLRIPTLNVQKFKMSEFQKCKLLIKNKILQTP